MTPKCWITWVLLSGLLWNLTAAKRKWKIKDELNRCQQKPTKIVVFADNFDLFTVASNSTSTSTSTSTRRRTACTMFIKENAPVNDISESFLPQMTNGSSHLLYLSKWYTQQNLTVQLVGGKNCYNTRCNYNFTDGEEIFSTLNNRGRCWIKHVNTKQLCHGTVYNETQCNVIAPDINKKYIINLTATEKTCYNCIPNIEKPKTEMNVKPPVEGTLRAASEAMDNAAGMAESMNESSAILSGGEAVQGVIMKIKETEIEAVSFAYDSPKDGLSIVNDGAYVQRFSRSVTVSNEAMEKALKANLSVPFVAVVRFTNLSMDANKSTILGNEVLGVEMGTKIDNLTDGIGINFLKMTYKGTPSCQSWNGKGDRPSWSDEGCLTHTNGSNITCQCSHLTFFAILLAPLNETISSSDLKNLTTITKVGCGMSMFFLCIVLFMHFLIRRTKATDSTKILIHLVSALFLLNLLFLINNTVADLKSSVGCKIVAALMHYFMLTTFTWFAVQALHLCLQIHTGGNIVINRYMLKVCLASWVTPSVIVAVLLILGKYGEQVINTNDPNEKVNMCWITDGNVHYIVNIGYYAIVFIFTFIAFTIMVTWLCLLKRNKKDDQQVNKSGISLMTVMGLCFMLGVTWGFAFFAYGALRIPSYYIFTVLNSFQGFFLFIYYYKSRSSADTKADPSDNSSTNVSRTTILANEMLGIDNPYSNVPAEQKPKPVEDD